MNDALFLKLKAPFPAKDIEWRVQQCGVGKDGKPWAKVLAYIQARAAQDRLDEVIGAGNWTVYYTVLSKGIKAKLAIKVGDTWVAKEDGAEQTEIEPFKGGLSSAFKRVASVWGIGRYLYGLTEGWAFITDKKDGAHYAKTKEGTVFYWLPPELPSWALPANEQKKERYRIDDFDITFGKYKGMNTKQINLEDLISYYDELNKTIEIDGKTPVPQAMAFYEKLRQYVNENTKE